MPSYFFAALGINRVPYLLRQPADPVEWGSKSKVIGGFVGKYPTLLKQTNCPVHMCSAARPVVAQLTRSRHVTIPVYTCG
ncbi:MAG: hypothetical protein ABSH01_15535 [Terriglobia bacterium]|jgi:hypothetical protein